MYEGIKSCRCPVVLVFPNLVGHTTLTTYLQHLINRRQYQEFGVCICRTTASSILIQATWDIILLMKGGVPSSVWTESSNQIIQFYIIYIWTIKMSYLLMFLSSAKNASSHFRLIYTSMFWNCCVPFVQLVCVPFGVIIPLFCLWKLTFQCSFKLV